MYILFTGYTLNAIHIHHIHHIYTLYTFYRSILYRPFTIAAGERGAQGHWVKYIYIYIRMNATTKISGDPKLFSEPWKFESDMCHGQTWTFWAQPWAASSAFEVPLLLHWFWRIGYTWFLYAKRTSKNTKKHHQHRPKTTIRPGPCAPGSKLSMAVVSDFNSLHVKKTDIFNIAMCMYTCIYIYIYM